MTPSYRVTVIDMAVDFVKRADNISTARRWAVQAFPKMQVTVTREYDVKRCPCCDSTPCVYGSRRGRR